MEVKVIEKYLRIFLDDVIIPKINAELIGEDDEPITIDIDNIMYGIGNPNRISFILHMEPNWSNSSFINNINLEISRFFRMLDSKKHLRIYWNKRPSS
jgi:hypothetical protein